MKNQRNRLIRLVLLETFDSQKIVEEIAIAIAINADSNRKKIDDFEENFEIFSCMKFYQSCNVQIGEFCDTKRGNLDVRERTTYGVFYWTSESRIREVYQGQWYPIFERFRLKNPLENILKTDITILKLNLVVKLFLRFPRNFKTFIFKPELSFLMKNHQNDNQSEFLDFYEFIGHSDNGYFREKFEKS